ncbi:hypothetical protein Klosneuvirus_2_109 [Klosneuvirus KNV1]|uniref:Uncharacterized protein n=1 Tax=Klosneuvirus KNV1 TaxID=1977640 RepID=A0A1V0SIY1_9VIRU|nr:hypothetical protein Klosneuvirus_2_109 [Klosneuvirus KNV1]
MEKQTVAPKIANKPVTRSTCPNIAPVEAKVSLNLPILLGDQQTQSTSQQASPSIAPVKMIPVDALVAILNALPHDQRVAIANALNTASAGPSVATAPVINIKTSDEDAKKALTAAENAVKTAQAKVAEMASRAAAHDQQVASVNTEKANFKITAETLEKSIKGFLQTLAGKDHIIASNIIEPAQCFMHCLQALNDVQRKTEECWNKLSQLTMEKGVISSEMKAAQDALVKADADLQKAQQLRKQ